MGGGGGIGSLLPRWSKKRKHQLHNSPWNVGTTTWTSFFPDCSSSLTYRHSSATSLLTSAIDVASPTRSRMDHATPARTVRHRLFLLIRAPSCVASVVHDGVGLACPSRGRRPRGRSHEFLERAAQVAEDCAHPCLSRALEVWIEVEHRLAVIALRF